MFSSLAGSDILDSEEFSSEQSSSSKQCDLFETLSNQNEKNENLKNKTFKNLSKNVILKILNDFYLFDLYPYYQMIVKIIYKKIKLKKEFNFSFFIKLFFGKFNDSYLQQQTLQQNTLQKNNLQQQTLQQNYLLFKNIKMEIPIKFINLEQSKHRHYYQVLLWLNQKETLNLIFGNLKLNFIEWKIPFPKIENILQESLQNGLQNGLQNSLQQNTQQKKKKVLIRSEEHGNILEQKRLNDLIDNTLFGNVCENGENGLQKGLQKNLQNGLQKVDMSQIVTQNNLQNFISEIFEFFIEKQIYKISIFGNFFKLKNTNLEIINLKHLEILNFKKKESLQNLTILKNLKNLEILKILNLPILDNSFFENFISKNRNLIHLEISIFHTLINLEILNILKKLKTLKIKIHLNKNQIYINGNLIFLNLKNLILENLEIFYLEKDTKLNVDIFVTNFLLNCHEKFKNLKNLKLKNCHFTKDLNLEILKLKNLQKLKIIEPILVDITKIEIPKTLQNFTIISFPNINNLKKENSLICNLTKKEFQEISLFGFENLNFLKFLILPKNEIFIKNNFLENNLNKINFLNLKNLNLSKNTLQNLHNVTLLQNLKFLNLKNTKFLTNISEILKIISQNCKLLISLKISYLNSREQFLQFFYNFNTLQYLTITHCKINKKILNLSILLLNKNLKKIKLQIDEPFPNENFNKVYNFCNIFTKFTNLENIDDILSINGSNNLTFWDIYKNSNNYLLNLEIKVQDISFDIMNQLIEYKKGNLLKLFLENKERQLEYHDLMKKL
ncbi:hypothetical protein ABK040_002709 [Willaertia magna]